MAHKLALWWNIGVFVYLGRMGDNKGVEHVLTAWCALKRQRPDSCPDLWLVGGSPLEIEAVRKKSLALAALSIHETSGRVRWWGYLNEEGISAVLLKACALLMHSSYEPGGRVILEAMAQGIPVIATPQGFALDLVSDWQTGFIVPYGDIESLRRRMEHFACTPLLGISLGIAARATALKAFDDWDFFKTHENSYLRAISRAEPIAMDAPHAPPAVICNPMPQGLMGRYPFPVAVPDTGDVVALAAGVLGVPPCGCRVEKVDAAGRSLVWYVHGRGEVVVVKHSYSTYVRRALWDYSYDGPLLYQGQVRRERALTASRLPGFASVLAEERALGLHVFPYLQPIDCSPLKIVQMALEPLSRLWSAPVVEDNDDLLSVAAQWWSERNAAPWRNNGKISAKLRNSCLRVAWAELLDKAKAQDLQLPADVTRQLKASTAVNNAIADKETDIVGLCHQHGDYSSSHTLRDGNNTYLIDGEKSAIGWWGRDAAFLLTRVGDGVPGAWWDESLALLCDTQEKKNIVLLWALIETVNEIARNTALGPETHHISNAPLQLEAILKRLAI